jgi:hypothetical protein
LSPDGRFANIFELLEHAGMARENLVEVTQYLVRQEHMPYIRRFVPSAFEMDMERGDGRRRRLRGTRHFIHSIFGRVGVRKVSPTHAPINPTFSRTLIGGAGRQ